MSGITNKVKDALSGREHTTDSTTVTTTHHRTPTTTAGGATTTTDVPTTNTTSGAYRSDVPHQHDHRVAPEALGTSTAGKTTGLTGLGGHGSHQDPTHQGPRHPVFADQDPTHTGGGAYSAGTAPQGYVPGATTHQVPATSGIDQRQGVGATAGLLPGSYPTTTTAGPHSTDLGNKLDPRVDSDRDGSTTLGQDRTTRAGGNTTTAGPHSTGLGNKVDPRVDSNRNGSTTLGQDHHHTTRTGGNTTTAAHKPTVPTTTTTSTAQYPGPAPHTAGPHKYDILNKLDPRVDSDLDGSKTIGGGTGTTKPGAY